jgi:hypothetical protein
MPTINLFSIEMILDEWTRRKHVEPTERFLENSDLSVLVSMLLNRSGTIISISWFDVHHVAENSRF